MRPRSAFLCYAGLAAAMTWPLLRDPGTLALSNNDMFGHVWGIAWVALRGFCDPLRLYDANMYWPHSLSLAYTESLLPQALMAWPVLALGGGPLLAHNLVLFLTFPLSGLSAFLLARELRCGTLPAFFAGLAWAFTAFRFEHFVHVGVLSIQWLPLALLLLRRAVLRPRLSTLAALGAVAVLQALSSGYHAVLLAVALVVAGAFLARRARRRRSVLRLALTLAVAALVAFLAAWPYRELQQRHSIVRGRGAYLHWSARPASYLDSGRYSSLPHLEWLRSQTLERMPLFPGTAVLGLAAFGLRGRRARLPVALALTGFVLSFGPELRLHAWTLPMPLDLLRRIPPVNMMRDASRFAFLFQLGLALLAALGASRLLRSRFGRPLVASALLLHAAEAWPRGLGAQLVEVQPPPASSEWLKTASPGPVLELPWDHEHRFSGGRFLYWSTVHWLPLVNGHGTFEAPGCFGLGVIAQTFPSENTAQILRGRGVRYVVLHSDEVEPSRRARLLARELPTGVRLAASFGPDRIYEIDASGPTRRQPPDEPGQP